MWNIVATLPLCLFSIWNCHGFVNAGDMLVSTPDPTCAIISINSRWHQLESGCGLWMDFTAMLGDVFSIFSILNNTFNSVRGGGFVNTKSETKKGSGTLLVMLYKDTAKSWDIYNWVVPAAGSIYFARLDQKLWPIHLHTWQCCARMWAVIPHAYFVIFL